jgi:hypothetical protein
MGLSTSTRRTALDRAAKRGGAISDRVSVVPAPARA